MLCYWSKVESNKEHIAAALETLKPTSSWERATAAGQGIEGVTMGGRGFGVAMDALIKYLGTEHGVTFAMGMKRSQKFVLAYEPHLDIPIIPTCRYLL
jgi:hypothetical protein